MYKTESLNKKQLESVAIDFAEEGEATDTIADLIMIYLKSKPGTWRLVSHCMMQFTHIFIWSIGD